MKWVTYICDEQHDDIPFLATKDAAMFYWTIAVDLPSYPTVAHYPVLDLSEAKAYWENMGYKLVPEEVGVI
jgi:hypothetical protein